MKNSIARMHRLGKPVLIFSIFLTLLLQSISPAFGATDTWWTSLHDVLRTSASTDTTIDTAHAPTLVKKWSTKTGGVIASSPTIVNGVVYVASWDGNEYAMDANTGAVKWKTNIGTTTANPICIPPKLGPSSAAAVVNNVVYVGGGDSYWYALDATSGSVLWKIYTGDNSASSGHYNWSSPLVVNGYAYIGIASVGDCPLVQGQLLKVDINTHQVVSTLNIVPNGEVGGGIWTSPAYDAATNTIYAATGTENSPSQIYSQAILAINADTMTITDSWKLPEKDAVLDSDFGTSTTLYDDENGNHMVVAINKNGHAYAFKRSNLAAGPVWDQQVALGGQCPTCGDSSVASAAIGQGKVFLAGEETIIGSQGYGGQVAAVDPATGSVLWHHPTNSEIIPAVTYDNGMVFVGEGSVFEVLDAATGNVLYSYNFGAGNGIYAAPSIANGIIYEGDLFGNVYAFTLPSTPPPTPKPDANCPTGFTCQDIGTVTPAGQESVTSGSWNISVGGIGYGNTADGYRFMSETTGGDSQIIAQITAQQNLNQFSQTGIMIRQNTDPGSPFYTVYHTPDNQLTVQERTTFGGQAGVIATKQNVALPVYLEIQRHGDQFSAATSTDGTNFTLLPGSTFTDVMPYSAMTGLAVSSDQQGTAATATIKNVSIGANTNTPQPTPPQTACPTGFNCQDIGNPATIGDQSLSSGTWTLKGAGNDIWDNYDQFHFVWQQQTGDATASAKIISQTSTDQSAKAGVMMRASTSADAAYYAAYLMPDGNLHVQYRFANGIRSSEQITTAQQPPAYVEIARSGTTFTTYTSSDDTHWVPVASSTVSMPYFNGTMLSGLAVTAHNASSINTATFSNLQFGTGAPPPPNLCPTGWTCSDIGFPTPAGDQTLSNGTWTIQAGGGDIWDISDQFRYIYQTQTTDGSFQTRVTSQTNTDTWAKAGVMYRASNAANDVNYSVFVTPANQVVVQDRATAGGTTVQPTSMTITSLPISLKISHTGTVYTAYTSTDGVTWNAIPNSTVTMTGLGTSVLAGLAVTSHNPSAASTVTMDSVALNTVTNCATGFTCTDIGAPAIPGSTTSSNNVITVNGSGNDIWGTIDQMQIAYQALQGDGTVTARVLSQTNSDAWAKAGVMIKESTTAGSKYVSMDVTPGNGLHMQYNFSGDQSGAASYTFPIWLQVKRMGNTFTAATSPDGTTWTTVGTTTLTMNTNAIAGIFVDAHNGGVLGSASFDNVTITSAGTALPSPWANTDIGSPPLSGSSTYNNGTYTVNGSGNDIWGTTDQLQYAYQPLNGDGTIVARVTSQTNTDAWAKAGVMVKEATTSGSKYVSMDVTPGNGYHMQWNFSGDQSGGTFSFPNAWVKLSRTGSQFVASASSNGTTWTQVGSTTLAMNTNATVGLFESSHNGTALGTATFDNVTVTSNGGPVPSPWTDTDVGNPPIAGSASYSNGVFTVNGNGNDVWGTTDQMHYVFQTLSGNQTITARITSETNTNAWTKAGIMVKQSATAGTPYAFVGITPGNGAVFQSNFNTSVSAGSYTLPNAWVRLSRNGNTITAFVSSNGTTWTQVGTATVSETDPITIGMFVCSHDGTQMATATFDSVTVTSP